MPRGPFEPQQTGRNGIRGRAGRARGSSTSCGRVISLGHWVEPPISAFGRGGHALAPSGDTAVALQVQSRNAFVCELKSLTGQAAHRVVSTQDAASCTSRTSGQCAATGRGARARNAVAGPSRAREWVSRRGVHAGHMNCSTTSCSLPAGVRTPPFARQPWSSTNPNSKPDSPRRARAAACASGCGWVVSAARWSRPGGCGGRSARSSWARRSSPSL
jgi:hypothetical protein